MDQNQQNNFRVLLTEAIIKLCQTEAVYSSELSIEGTVCVVSDRTSVIIAHFTECIGDRDTRSLSLDDERGDSSVSVFQQHVGDPSLDHAELLLPDVKVEQMLPDDEIITTFEAVNDSDGLTVMHDFYDPAEKSLNVSNDCGMDNVNQSAGGRYQCLQCDKVCSSERTLQKHVKIHGNCQLCNCVYCCATFTSVTELQQHIKRQHSQVSDKKVANKLRKQRVASQDVQLISQEVNSADQDEHQNMNIDVSDDKEMTDSCLETEGVDAMALLEALEQNDYKKMFANAHLLTNTATVENHAVQPLTKCQKRVAPKTCSSKSKDLHKCRNNTKSTIMQYFEKVHVEMPNGLYKYRCCLCQKMFKIRTSLYEHINSHTGLRRYACDQCDSRFVHHSTLHNHVRNKHMAASHRKGRLRYPCTGCDRQFKFFSQFKRHLLSNPSHCTSQ